MKVFVVYIIFIHFLTIIVTKDNQKSKKLFENKERYGGDMMGQAPKQKGVARKASSSTNRVWPNGTVIYKFANKGFNAQEKSYIESTMKYIEGLTCIRFKKRNAQKDFINIMKEDGCYSYVGRIGGKQDMSLGDGCLYKGTIIHELMHALGFYHEHMRSDRDQYLTIHMNQVRPGMSENFEKNPSSMNRLLTKFDYNSIMIYSSTAFSKNGQLTMEPKDKKYKLKEPYDKTGMTSLDALSINKMYDCPQDQPLRSKSKTNNKSKS